MMEHVAYNGEIVEILYFFSLNYVPDQLTTDKKDNLTI